MVWKKRIYLDRAAGVAGNPSSPHEEGRRAKGVLENARTDIARLLEVQSDDVIFTSGATESNALAILGSVRALQAKGRKNMHVLYLPSAHASIVENVALLAEEGVTIEALPIRDWHVDIKRLATMVRKETVLVVMEAVCGETGVVWNTREVAEVLRKARVGGADARILLHVDASQAPLTEKISRAHFDADMLTLDGAKVGPLHGIGVLIAHRTLPLAPLYKGGGQERGLRSGTENVDLAHRFAVALRTTAHSHTTFRTSATGDRAHLTTLITRTIPDVYINEGHSQVPHILNLSLLGRDTDYLVALLDEDGFAIATRSACETDSENGSRAVFVLTGEAERARATIRISWGSGVSRRDITRCARALVQATGFIDSASQR